MSERAKCVVCGEEQVDVEYLDPVMRLVGPTGERRVQVLHIGFPVCYQHQVKDLSPDHYVFSDLLVEVER